MTYRVMTKDTLGSMPAAAHMDDFEVVDNATGLVHTALAKTGQSQTARKIVDFVASSAKTVYILVHRYGAEIDQFSPINHECGFIFWCPDANAVIQGGGLPGGQNKATGWIEAGDSGVFHPELRLLHEVGHAVQWIEDSGRFEILKDYKSIVRGQGIPLRLEQDNIKRHEWPICDEMGWPKRVGYQHLKLT